MAKDTPCGFKYFSSKSSWLIATGKGRQHQQQQQLIHATSRSSLRADGITAADISLMTYLADRRWPCVKLSSLLALLCIVCTPGSCTQEKSSRTVGRIQNLNSSVGEDTFDSSGTARSGVLDIAARPLVSIVDTKVPEPLDKSARLRGRALSSVQGELRCLSSRGNELLSSWRPADRCREFHPSLLHVSNVV